MIELIPEKNENIVGKWKFYQEPCISCTFDIVKKFLFIPAMPWSNRYFLTYKSFFFQYSHHNFIRNPNPPDFMLPSYQLTVNE